MSFSIGRWILLVMAFLSIGCATKAEESAPTPKSESLEVGVNDEHVLYEGDDREAVLKSLAQAFDLYGKTPRTDGGMPTFKSLESHSQEHIMKLTWENREKKRLRVNTYPAKDPQWEASFVVDETGKIVEMVTATEEPAPLPE